MKIGELSKRTGSSPRALRHYEKLRIIHSERMENGYRRYPEDMVENVKAVRFLLCAGLSLSTISSILPSLMNRECKLDNPRIRAIVEQEAIKVKQRMGQLERSSDILNAALEKGYIRRPPDRTTTESGPRGLKSIDPVFAPEGDPHGLQAME